ncbi:MAG: hypothetical protein HY898_02245 [Deltaproteobacteria bacterium]|nr:hypothetical protein [Deltaproteobacteria bacterium]
MANDESEHETRIRAQLNQAIGTGLPVLVRSTFGGVATSRIAQVVGVCARHCLLLSPGVGERVVPWTIATITSVETAPTTPAPVEPVEREEGVQP